VKDTLNPEQIARKLTVPQKRGLAAMTGAHDADLFLEDLPVPKTFEILTERYALASFENSMETAHGYVLTDRGRAVMALIGQELERDRMVRVRPNRVGHPRDASFLVEFHESGERITLLGVDTYAPQIHALKGLTRIQRETGVTYGAICEELETSGLKGMDLNRSSGGDGSGPERAIDRRLRMRARRDQARAVLASLPAMEPKYRARKPTGSASLGQVHRAVFGAGAMLRKDISARALVDAICIGEGTICGVLKANGWSNGPANKRRIGVLLKDALDAIALQWLGGVATGPERGHIHVLTPDSGLGPILRGSGREHVLEADGSLSERLPQKRA